MNTQVHFQILFNELLHYSELIGLILFLEILAMMNQYVAFASAFFALYRDHFPGA